MADYAELEVVRRLQEDESWATLLGEAFVKIRTGFWKDEYVRMIVDRWPSSLLTFGDVFAFLQVHGLLVEGKAVMTAIDVGEPPYADKYVTENHALLQTLPEPFSGEFWGATDDQDGRIRWSKPIMANTVRGDGKEVRVTVPPGQAPLEVGHTNGSTTFLHIQGAHRLARWPYDSTRITIIHLIDPPTVGWTETRY